MVCGVKCKTIASAIATQRVKNAKGKGRRLLKGIALLAARYAVTVMQPAASAKSAFDFGLIKRIGKPRRTESSQWFTEARDRNCK